MAVSTRDVLGPERYAYVQSLPDGVRAGVELLWLAGTLLYGPRWQVELAQRAGVNDRTMRRYANGVREVPTDILEHLAASLEERVASAREMATQLRRAVRARERSGAPGRQPPTGDP